MTTNFKKYQRIARFYDLIDLPFERRRYRAIRPLLFRGMTGQVLDASILRWSRGRHLRLHELCEHGWSSGEEVVVTSVCSITLDESLSGSTP